MSSKVIDINLKEYPRISQEVRNCLENSEVTKKVALGVLRNIKIKSDLKTGFNVFSFFAKPVVSIPAGAALIFLSMNILNSIMGLSFSAAFPILLASALIITLFAGLCLVAFGIAHCIFGKFPNVFKGQNGTKGLMNYIEKNVEDGEKVKFKFSDK
jgi:hypothetical protein